MNLNKNKNLETFYFTEDENRIMSVESVDEKLLKETCLHWWYHKINKKEHKELWGYKDVMEELQFSPPTKALKRGGICFQKGFENFSHLQKNI
jgi:hypothetical protein